MPEKVQLNEVSLACCSIEFRRNTVDTNDVPLCSWYICALPAKNLHTLSYLSIHTNVHCLCRYSIAVLCQIRPAGCHFIAELRVGCSHRLLLFVHTQAKKDRERDRDVRRELSSLSSGKILSVSSIGAKTVRRFVPQSSLPWPSTCNATVPPGSRCPPSAPFPYVSMMC